MASVDDIGSDTEEFFNKLALSARKPEVQQASTGFCLWCDEPISEGRRWCDADCCKDWTANQ